MPSRRLLLAALAAALAPVVPVVRPAPGAAASAGACPATRPALRALGLREKPTTTPDGVALDRWSGLVASWDGIPLDVDLTLPAGGGCRLPVVVWGHGWGGDKTDREAAGRLATGSADEDDWNNVSMAYRGVGSLNFSMRGWHRSCGPDAAAGPPGVPKTPASLPAACTKDGRQYWVHLDDLRYEIRDAQWLTGLLVDAGVADAHRIAASGGSYGGGQTLLLTVLNDRTMCGGAAWDASHGPDPCAGRPIGALVPWRSPRGTPLSIAAAVPFYTWADEASALAPNGRASDGAPGAPLVPSEAALESPVGVLLESYVDGLYADADTPPLLENGFYQPPTSTDDTASIPLWFALAHTGPAEGTLDRHALDELAQFKSPLTPLVPLDARVPVFWAQGFTDPLFPAVQALMMRARLLAFAPDYPITIALGDIGHAYAANPPEVWSAIIARANAFLDRVLRGRGPAASPGVLAALTRCRPATDGPLTLYWGPSLPAMATRQVVLRSTTVGITSNTAVGGRGPSTDPILESYVESYVLGGGCPLLSARPPDPGTASWSWPVPRAATLLGAPVLEASVRTTGVVAQLAARLWDIGTDGSEALIGRTVYRLDGPLVAGTRVVFELSANAWRLVPGHTLRLELIGADAPTYQPDVLPATTVIDSVSLRLPLLDPAHVVVAHA